MYNSEEKGQVLTVVCPKQLDDAAGQELIKRSSDWLLRPVQYVVLDMKAVKTILPEFYKTIILFKTSLRRESKTIYSINISPEVMKLIKTAGIEQSFNPIKALEIENEKTKPNSPPTLNVEFINPFLSAAQKTLETQCQTKVKPLTPYLKKEHVDNIAIAGVLNLGSNGFAGSIVLCFPAPVFLKIYENMFGEKHEKIVPEIEDAVAELLNIIYGQAKIELNPKGYNFQRALPTVLTGEKLKIRQSSSSPAVIVPFESSAGNFHIEIEFEKALGGGDV